MKFTCKTEELNSAISSASRAVSTRSSMPVLEGLYIKADKDAGLLYVTGNDLEIAIEAYIPADITEGGGVVLNAKLLAKIGVTSGGEDVKVETNKENLTEIKAGRAKIEIMGIPEGEFPDLPGVDKDYYATLPAAVLKNMIETTAFSAAKSDSDPVRTGAQLKISEHDLSMVTLDGYRIAKRTVHLEGTYEPHEMIIPAESLVNLARIIGTSEEEGEVEITATNNHAIFKIGNCRMITRLIEGTYTNYERIIPSSYELELRCSKKDIAEAVRRASLIILNDLIKGPIRFRIGDGQINVSCSTTAGSVEEYVDVDTPVDADLEIGFYDRYLQEVFNVISEENIMMNFNKSVNPLVITPANGSDDFMYMILPIRLRTTGR